MALRLRVCSTGEVKPGETKGFAVPGVAVPVMVANIDGTFVAASSMCPHEDVSLLGGKRKGTRVICPGHGYQFDLITGACSHSPNMTLPRYKVTVVGDAIYVDLI
jgi:nitrite reductase/ring-hydroxylating ferredoxin subunit